MGQLSEKMGKWFFDLNRKLRELEAVSHFQAKDHTILLCFHGHSLAHTIRPLVIARSLRECGYNVLLAGDGRFTTKISDAGFTVYPLVTMSQDRMDECVAKGDYAYYDLDWIDRCVQSERELIHKINPSFKKRLIDSVETNAVIQALLSPG